MTDITDAEVEIGCKAAYTACDMGPFPDMAAVPESDRRFVRAALEAATRARQGEGIALEAPTGLPTRAWTQAEKDGTREVAQWINEQEAQTGTEPAPNAADAEAICPACAKPVSVHNLTTAREIEIWFSAWKHAWSDEARTAAPVPAEQDRVGRLQIYVEKELCSLLGRPWATSGFSIETLIADLRKRLAVPADEGEKK